LVLYNVVIGVLSICNFLKKSRIWPLPPCRIISTCNGDHVSMKMDRTKLTWTPKLRCFPAQSKQIRVPWLMLPQSVSNDGQSQHLWLPGYSLISRSTPSGNGDEDDDIVSLLQLTAPNTVSAARVPCALLWRRGAWRCVWPSAVCRVSSWCV